MREAGLELVLLPYEAGDQSLYPLPQGVACNMTLNEHPESHIVFRALKGLVSKWTWKEFVAKDRFKALKTLNHLINRSSRVRHYVPILKRMLEKEVRENGQVPVIYTDRFDALTYAACYLKRFFPELRVVTRAIGYDIYRERYQNCYPPLRLQFANMPDMICPVTEVGTQYLIKEYGIPSCCVRTYFRGVAVSAQRSGPGRQGELRLVSCSFCTPIKRLPLLVRSVAAYAEARPNLVVYWTHIGDGELYEELLLLAHELLDGIPNVRWEMPGRFNLDEIKQYYKTHAVDSHILISELEGLPKSIMEAQALGVPSVATKVGGVADIVNENTGIMIPRDFSQHEFAAALDGIVSFRDDAVREKIQKYCEEYFSENNSRKFIDEIFWRFCNHFPV
ncbi:glycosyltransferase [Desulfovibrio mangrovi]|uniref:glycosyltransferase n=1 Tax=Desulfovibrio mangrovi TaxID=2976983 RepID=UPI0022481BE6|nr:glycosyltransferase [Desulfovibrio mangrovi]UZP66669.1 glycosyltransferase [Desulfovibrio mangrovi]